jgi:predicted nucleic acid-binding Zn ribbon protein
MEKKDFQKIDSVLKQFARANNLEQGLAEYRLMKSWDELLGTTIAKKTRSLRISNRKLFVTLYSSVVRNELEMIKDTLISRLNMAAGKDVIDDIVFR